MAYSNKYQRINETLLEYWHDKASGDNLPCEVDIDPDAFGDLWNHCFLVKIENDSKYRYIYMGDAIIEAYGDDLTGHEVCEKLVGEIEEPLIKEFQKVRSVKQPIQEESSFINRRQMEIRYRSCLLPLRGDNSEEVRYILGGMKWKAY